MAHLKPYIITQADIDSITKAEAVWGTTRLLPLENQIPKEFWKCNTYTEIADAMFVGDTPSIESIKVKPGFNEENIESFKQCFQAHLRSFQPQHEHKIAGLAYMISCVMEVTLKKKESNE